MRARAALWGCLALSLAAVAMAAQVKCDYDNPEGCDHQGRTIAQPPGEDLAKRAWPELVGQPARQARVAIEADNPELTVQVVPPHTVVTADYREDRVRLYVDEAMKVTRVPRIG